MSIREDAIKWWRGLTQTDQVELAKMYYPEKGFIVVTTCSQKIEMMYRFVELDQGVI